MTGSTQTLPITSPGPIKLPPGSLETVEELPGDSDLEDEQSDTGDSVSDFVLSNIEEDDEEEGGSLLERDPVFDKIKESLTRSQKRSESVLSQISSLSDESDGPQVQISEQYTSIPYGIQPRATYEHSAQQADIMGVAYNGRMRQFVILDPKGITTWKRDLVDPRGRIFDEIRRALQYPKYEYRLIVNIVYAPKYNCYFALGKDFSVKVLNRDFEETCSVNTDMRSVLYILFNPVRDELITGGVGGIKIWQFLQAAGKAFTELKPLANYELKLKESLPNVGGSWVKRVDLDHYLQHLYCCSDTDLHVYDLTGKLLFKFERAHTMSITGCCFSPSAKVLVTASVDSEVKVWSLTGGLVHTFRGHSRAVTGLLLHPDTSTILITSSLDGSIRMWSLDTMDLLYMIVVSADGVMWMGLTDDKMLYISTCRNITLWHLNKFYSFWGVARNSVTHLSLASAESKTTRVLAIGDDSSVRLFTRCNQKNITTVLPPPDISPLQKVLGVCYSREKNAAFLLITNKEIWVYTTRTDPSCRIAVWDVHDLQMPYISGDTSALPPGVTIQPPSQSMATHRATENGHGNEIISNCCSLCILNSTAMMWTEEGLCCPIRHTYLLLGMEDGRVLFMDPVIKGQKYMEFKASKDAIQEMRHDVANSSLITLCRLKTLVMIQIWGLPQLDAMYELYCGPDVTCFSRIGLTMMTGHTSGQINCHALEPVEDLGMIKSKLEPAYETVVDEKRRPEHHAPLVAMDALISLRMFVTCSSDGGIKVWDENKVLVTEVMLETSLSAATFLNEMGDLIVGFKNHIFYIDHSKLFPAFKPDEVEMETSDQESDVYEDPRVLYEVIQQDQEPVTLENYLVPFDHLEFDKDFLEGKTKIEQPKGAPDLIEETETETESDISLAPSSIYLSPADSIESLSRIDLTLGADYSKYDLRKQMKSTLDVVFARAKEANKWKNLRPAQQFLKLRRIQLTNAKNSKYVHKKRRKGQKSRKRVTIETPGQSDMEEKEIEMELEKYNLPTFGESPGGSPSITPPSGQASPRDRGFHSEEEYSGEETVVKKSSGFVPIVPEKGSDSPPVTAVGKYTSTAIKSYGQNSAVQGLTRSGTVDQSLNSNNMGFSFPDEYLESKMVRSKHYHQKQSNIKESHQTKIKTDHVHLSKKTEHPESTGSKANQESHNVTDEMSADGKTADEITVYSVGKKRAVRPKKTKVQRVPQASAEPQTKIGMSLNKDYDTDTDEEIRAIDASVSEKSNNGKADTKSESVVEVLSVGDSESGTDSLSDTESGLAPSLAIESMLPDSQSVTDSGVQESLSVSMTHESGGQLDMPDLASSALQNTHESELATDHDEVQTSEAGTPASKLEKPSAEYEDGEDSDHGRKKSKGVKVDVRGLMKKRRITSGRAPSLTRRASTDHSHDDHDHGHDDKRTIKKKQPMDDRKLPPRVDMSKLKDLPPNPPSMLSRKRSMSEQRKSLEINLLHHPEFPRRQDGAVDTNLSHVKFDQPDVEQLQEEAWAAEAGLHGKPLTLPPQRDKNQARMSNRPSPGDTPSTRDRKFVFGNRESVEGQIPGVGSSPTAEMEEQDRLETGKDTGSSLDNKPAVTVNKSQGTSTEGKISRGTPDSGIIDDTMPPLGHQTPTITVSKVPSSQEPADGHEALPTDASLLTEEDKASAIRRPASSFTGLRRGQLEGERLRSERPHTAHVRFKAEDLQSAFEEALQRYQNLPGTPAAVSAEKLYKNDGVTFEDNWQERAIERHTLLRMQKEIRAQSAAQRRQAMEMIQKDKMASKHFPSRCDSAVGMSDTAQGSLRATTSMSVPITMGYGLRNDSAPSREKQRPKTANPVLEKQQMAKSDLSNEKPFRFRLSKDAPSKSRPSSSRSISTVADFSPHWIDPRNPDAWRPKSSRSIPSKCNRYVLVNQPREKPSAPVPSPLEEQLLVERFPRMGSKLVQTIPESTPRIKKSYSLEYSPFVYQRFV